MERVAVVHLVRKANGADVFRAFIRSYRDNAAGTAHDLVLLCKGFESPDEFDEYDGLLAGIEHSRRFVPDEGFDIGSYALALRQTNFDYYCFLNSFSVILAPLWLSKLQCCWRLAGVGLVGATGSYESTSENLRREIRSMRNVFRRRWLRARLRLFTLRREYPGFPNPTIRTNAFAARGDLLREVFPHPIRTKEDALRFESGYQSLTRQIQARGLEARIVGRDGRSYSPDAWPASRTFRLSDQSNLLIADNQTERYAHASRDEQQWLSTLAWGSSPEQPLRQLDEGS